VLTIPNHHPVEGCGEPPEIPTDNAYLSYFENRHGEQWLFWVDQDTRRAFVTGGDVGWEVTDLAKSKMLPRDVEQEAELSKPFREAFDEAVRQAAKATGDEDPTFADALDSGVYARVQPYSEEEWAWLRACWKVSEWARNPLPKDIGEEGDDNDERPVAF
jgi:hypothetical protein